MSYTVQGDKSVRSARQTKGGEPRSGEMPVLDVLSDPTLSLLSCEVQTVSTNLSGPPSLSSEGL